MLRRTGPTTLNWRCEPLRHLTVLIGFVCLFTQLSSVVHMALVEHVRCAEHGEWVHGQHAHAARAPEAAAAEGDPTSVRSDEAAEVHGHDHCVTCAERRELALPFASPPELANVASARLRASVLSSAAFVGKNRFSFAPKTSPPVSCV